jgi:hypothetical protein
MPAMALHNRCLTDSCCLQSMSQAGLSVLLQSPAPYGASSSKPSKHQSQVIGTPSYTFKKRVWCEYKGTQYTPDSQTFRQDPRLRLETQPSILDSNEPSSGVRYEPNSLHWLDEMYMSTGGLGETESNTTATINGGSYVFNEAFNLKQTMIPLHSSAVDLELFNFSDALNGDSQWLHSLQPHVDTAFTPLGSSLPQSISQPSSAVATDPVEDSSSNLTPISDKLSKIVSRAQSTFFVVSRSPTKLEMKDRIVRQGRSCRLVYKLLPGRSIDYRRFWYVLARGRHTLVSRWLQYA